MRILLGIVGFVLVLFGGLFLLQGMDVIRWPTHSFMLGQQTWVLRGAVMTVVGGVLIAWALVIGSRR